MYFLENTIEMGGKFLQRRLSRLRHYDSRFGRNQERSTKALWSYVTYMPTSMMTAALDVVSNFDDTYTKSDFIENRMPLVLLYAAINGAIEDYPLHEAEIALKSEVTRVADEFEDDSVEEMYEQLLSIAPSYRIN